MKKFSDYRRYFSGDFETPFKKFHVCDPENILIGKLIIHNLPKLKFNTINIATDNLGEFEIF